MLFTVPQNFEFVKYFFQSFLTSLAALRSSNFFSLPHSEAFVKNFFQKFLKLASAISAATILGYHILWLLSSVFFHFTLWRSAYRADSFVRIPNHSAFVNTIFQLSSLFLIFTITRPYPSPTSVHFGNQSVQNTLPVL